jgi:hypothetical protein
MLDALNHDEDGRRQAQVLVTAVHDGDPDEILDVLADFLARLVPLLPDDHPLARALRGGMRLSSGGARLQLPPQVVAAFADLSGDTPPASAGHGTAETPDHTGLPADVYRRLLAVAALSPRDVWESGQDPWAPDVLRLVDDTGRVRVPAFQFTADRVPIPVVLGVNRLLGCDDDPWGVADWWFGENAWLDAVPARLVGVVADDLLRAGAEAVLR